MKEILLLILVAIVAVVFYFGATDKLSERGIIDRSWHDAPESHLQSPVTATPKRESVFH